ncbi:MAG: hypothetical protein ACOZBL_04670 [Patescibacteria group bacterium]
MNRPNVQASSTSFAVVSSREDVSLNIHSLASFLLVTFNCSTANLFNNNAASHLDRLAKNSVFAGANFVTFVSKSFVHAFHVSSSILAGFVAQVKVSPLIVGKVTSVVSFVQVLALDSKVAINRSQVMLEVQDRFSTVQVVATLPVITVQVNVVQVVVITVQVITEPLEVLVVTVPVATAQVVFALTADTKNAPVATRLNNSVFFIFFQFHL